MKIAVYSIAGAPPEVSRRKMRAMNIGFYVYLHRRPSGSVFYVGKGSTNRAFERVGRNIYWRRIVAKDGWFEVEIIETGLSEAMAYEREVYWIAHHAEDARLANLSMGGVGGASGYAASPETRAKISRASTGRKHTPETRALMSARKKGIAFWPKGKKRPPEFGAQISASRKGVPVSPEHAAKNRVQMIGRKHSEATIRKMREQRKYGGPSNRPISVCGINFQSMTAFAKFVGVTPLCVKKWVDAGKVQRMERAFQEVNCDAA